MKKVLSFLITLCIISSQINVYASEAEVNVSTSGIYALYQTVTGVCDTERNLSGAEYQWLLSQSRDGSYSIIENTHTDDPTKICLIDAELTDNTVQVNPDGNETFEITQKVFLGLSPNSFDGKWIKFRVVLDGENYDSEPRQVVSNIVNYQRIINSKDELFEVNTETPEDNIFLVDGQEFILLDTTECDNAHFLVMANETYGSRKYYNITLNQNFYEMAYWLNNTFVTEGNGGKKLPEAITDNISERYWGVERGYWWHMNNIYNMAVYTGIALPSQSEIKKYADKIGLTDCEADWWTRTPASGSSSDGNAIIAVYANVDDAGKTFIAHGNNEEHAIRPIFYLNKTFFENVHIPLENMGSSVRKILFERYMVEELRTMGYTATEIEKYSSGEINSVSIEGEAKVNGTLQSVVSTGNMDESCLSYRWKISDSENGEYRGISGAFNSNITLSMNEAAKWIKVFVTKGNGEVVESEALYVQDVWDTSFEGTVSDVKIKGISETFQLLSISYEFDEITSEDDIITRQWYVSSMQNSGYTAIDKAVNNTYRVSYENASKWIKASITLKNKVVYETDPVKIGPALDSSRKRIENTETSKFSTVNAQTPSEYVFFVDGQEFILLDSTNSDTSRFLVMSKNLFGKKTFYDTDDQSQQFTQMIEWLNTEFLEQGNDGKSLPQKIVDYIDFEQGWKCSGRRWVAGERGYLGGIALPALHEIETYSEKIGLQDESVSWWLRTPCGDDFSDGNYVQYVCGEAEMLGQTYGSHGSNSEHGIRPIFYIDESFFREYRLDLETTGSAVLETIKNNYEKHQLTGLYSMYELEDKFGYEEDYLFSAYLLGNIDAENVDVYYYVYNLAETDELSVLICVYDENNSLHSSYIKTHTIEKEGIVEDTASLTGVPNGMEGYVKIYVVDKNNNWAPMAVSKLSE